MELIYDFDTYYTVYIRGYTQQEGTTHAVGTPHKYFPGAL